MKYIFVSRAATTKVSHWRILQEHAILTEFYDDNDKLILSFCLYVRDGITKDSDSPHDIMFLDKYCANWWIHLFKVCPERFFRIQDDILIELDSISQKEVSF